MPVTNLRFNITSDWDGGGVRAAASALNGVGRNVERMNSRLGSGLAGMQLWQKAALALAPAMFTLGKAALAGLGGLTALAAVVAAATAPFIGLGITAALNADKMGAAGQSYTRAANSVRDAWMDLARRTAPLTLGPMTDVLEGVATAIPKLEPLVRRIAPVFAEMGRALRGWLEGAGFERFLRNVSDFGVPAFRNLVNASRDFLATAGIGFRQFLPLAVDISEAIERGAARLRSWAEGGGFTRFLADVRREWPTVRRFLGEAAESLGNIGQVLNDLGPGELNALSSVLDKFNDVDVDGWRSFLLTLAGLRIGGGLLSLLAGLANIRGGRLQIAGGAALLGAAGALAGAGATLLSAAAALEAAAASLASAGVAAGAGGLIGGLLGRLAGGSATFNITISPSDAADQLERIRDVFTSLNGQTATATVTLNASGFTGAASALLSQWTTIKAAAAVPAIFRAMAIPGNVPFVAASVIAAWAGVRAAAAVPAIFRAMAIPGNVPAVAAQVIAAWAGVRAAAAVPAIFRAMAIPGNVAAVAASVIAAWAGVRAAAAVPAVFRAMAIPGNVPAVAAVVIAAWARVRAAAASVPNFRATASAGNVVSVANQIVSAWNRVKSAAASRPTFTATANVSSVVSGAAQAAAAWQRVLAMPRTWTATATVNSGAAVSGANAVRSAWQSVLSMPRSVTFTVNVVTNESGGATGGPAEAFGTRMTGFASGGRVFGPGGPRSDRIAAWLSRGEYVVRASAVKALGPGFMGWINSAGSGSGLSDSAGKGGMTPMPVIGGSGGGDIAVHFHGSVYAKTDADFQDMVTTAVQEMKRRGRI